LGIRVHVFVFQNLNKCYHFEWIDEYVEMLEVEGIIDFRRGATWEFIPAPAVEKLPRVMGN
jgi:hypothetical protein